MYVYKYICIYKFFYIYIYCIHGCMIISSFKFARDLPQVSCWYFLVNGSAGCFNLFLDLLKMIRFFLTWEIHNNGNYVY